MARVATLIGHAVDYWGDTWDVRESRDTPHGWPVLLGWPAGVPRGRGGAGGPTVIVTPELAAYFEGLRGFRRPPIGLPVGRSAIKRIRRLLAIDSALDRAAWWEDRADDLADLTIDRFAARHGVSTGAAAMARLALLGPTLRPAGWWRAADVAAELLADRPRAAIADSLNISVGAVRRLRCQIKHEREEEAD